MSLLSVIVPSYNEEKAIPFFYDEMKKTEEEFAQKYPDVKFEYVFIDDGSVDATMDVIKKLREHDERVHYVSFSRNFCIDSQMIGSSSTISILIFFIVSAPVNTLFNIITYNSLFENSLIK